MTPGPRARARARLVAALSATMGGTAALVEIGSGPLSPPLLHPREIPRWVDALGSAGCAFAVLRLGALAAGGYLAVVLTLGLILTLPRGPRWHRGAGRLAPLVPAPLRVALIVALGVSAVAAGAAPALASAESLPGPPGATTTSVSTAPGPSAAPTLREVPSPAPPAAPPPANHSPAGRLAHTRPSTPARRHPGAPVRHRVASATSPAPEPTSRAPTLQRADLSAGPRAASRPATWTVAPGDSFWSIAAAVTSQRLGHHGTTAEIARYWETLVKANAAHLPVPGDPDLLFAGDIVRLPPGR